MKIRIITLLATIISLSVLSGTALAVDFVPQCKDKDNAKSSLCPDINNPGDNPVTDVLGKIARIISYVTGVASVFMVIAGGLMYVTSAGDSGKTTSGRKMITYALVGLVVTVLAGTIAGVLTHRIF